MEDLSEGVVSVEDLSLEGSFFEEWVREVLFLVEWALEAL